MTPMRFSALFCALVALLLAARPAQAAFMTVNGVDSGFGGAMNITTFSPSYDSMTQDYSIVITAEDTSATESYQGVGLAFEFVYPASSAMGNPTNGNGFTYEGTDDWKDTTISDAEFNDEVQYLSSTPSLLGSLNMANTDLPPTGSSGGFMASVSPTATIPMVELGDFTPLQSKTFTVTAKSVSGNFFIYNSDQFFVAVPEPSSLALIAFGAVGICLSLVRRHGKKSQLSRP